MNGLLVGVDAGGTSTRALALDLETGDKRTARGDGANWTVHGPEVCAARLTAAVSEAAAGRPIHSLALCIAGYYPPDHWEAANAWARATWPEVPHLSIQTDVHAAWAGAFGGEPGIVVISGTGSIAYGRNAMGEEARAGGWGPLFGDEGSAYGIGLHALRLASRAVDRSTGELIAFHCALLERWPALGADLRSWLRGIYRLGWTREQVAEIGGLAAQRADSGDGHAQSLLNMAARELMDLADVVSCRLHLPAPGSVSLQGGVGEGSVCLREEFSRLASSTLVLSPPRFPAVAGAVILAAGESGLDRGQVTGQLRE